MDMSDLPPIGEPRVKPPDEVPSDMERAWQSVPVDGYEGLRDFIAPGLFKVRGRGDNRIYLRLIEVDEERGVKLVMDDLAQHHEFNLSPEAVRSLASGLRLVSERWLKP
jgi:hypothetical protein